ncbi:hypothetical protein DO021_17355 [Desulfobacter hydrogenophilus]|uniref:FlgO domain-containing protein n=1 Tax=Desulfobacter hydrogenophilus TaxID=2291 RepID=A0A328F940_9BACT|nr:FlgO family outer membrane protein [Desulfobacter hydrogenophilus]NDY73408.1 hypothetical protein [Desulfobacter hydrogenophilus]QBH12425.1 hypothetical protein EYB58_05575 [Desulfobacter hydrogenophilus]RAM00736.1 hypothetical protein DO021_17355 [Desulfobacter hydrogenophilus]
MKIIVTVFTLLSISLAANIGLLSANEVAGSVEAGLEALATEIVNKSLAADKTTIAVLPFPHSDRNCSVLSTYIVDELILHLFNVPNSSLKIIERSQLEALISEIKLGAGGLLNPKTTKQLGDISGVQALTIGTITVIGDRIRINARLVETNTARTISAAAISIPKTQAIENLLEQEMESGPLCGGTTTALGADPEANPVNKYRMDTPYANTNKKGAFCAEGLRFFIQNISRSQNLKSVNLVLGVTNETKASLPVIFVTPIPSIVDNKGNIMYLNNVTGIQGCHMNNRDWNMDPAKCIKYRRSSFTTLSPNTLHTVLLRFEMKSKDEDEKFDGNLISFSSRAQIILDEKQKKYKNIAVCIPNIPIK